MVLQSYGGPNLMKSAEDSDPSNRVVQGQIPSPRFLEKLVKLNRVQKNNPLVASKLTRRELFLIINAPIKTYSHINVIEQIKRSCIQSCCFCAWYKMVGSIKILNINTQANILSPEEKQNKQREFHQQFQKHECCF